MATFRVFAPRQVSDVLVPSWNGTIRPGDDLKVAFTLLHEDGETPLIVAGARARMTLYAADPRVPWLWTPDYGLGALTSASRPIVSAVGHIIDELAGRLNFFLPASQTASLCSSVRAFIEVDLPDGLGTAVQGTLQVRHPMDGLGHTMPIFMRIGVTPIGTGMLAERTLLNIPVDDDGFPLIDPTLPVIGSQPDTGGVPTDPTSSILGIGVLGQMILAPGGVFIGPTSSVLGTGVLGQMILAPG